MTFLPTRGGDKTTTRRRRSGPTSRIALISLGFLLILSEACSLSCAAAASGGLPWSPARKTRFFATPAGEPDGGPRAAANEVRSNHGKSSSYEEEKRLVHTGPNPLHN